jgi:DNA-directed RNA polymerase specialized sigma24 family protein
VSNKRAENDFGNNTKRSLVSKICRQYFTQYRKDFEAIAIFDLEDLEQEVWCKTLESNIYSGGDDLGGWVVRILNHMLVKGTKRNGIAEITSVSQLPYKDRRAVENIMYGGSEGGYDEESQP